MAIERFVSKFRLGEEPGNAVVWKNYSASERVSALESIRREYHLNKYGAEPRLQELLELLNKNGVKYLVVGGYSVAIHGHPRYTKDIDIWILTNRENAVSLIQALDDFGFGSFGLSVTDFETPGHVVQLGNAPARIDILTSLTGVDFDACWQNKIYVEGEGLIYPVISLNDLRTNKRALARHQDLADLEQLGDD